LFVGLPDDQGELNRKSFAEFRYQGPDKYGHYDPGHKKKSD
jgi:hypothetical protein